MTPKEKAIELYSKMYRTGFKSKNALIRAEQAKECALITVGEMIEMLKELERVGFLKLNSAIPIIEEIKKEIEEL